LPEIILKMEEEVEMLRKKVAELEQKLDTKEDEE
jgi:hypothetical protein